MKTLRALDEDNQAFLDDWSLKSPNFKENFILGLILFLGLAVAGYMAVIAFS
jgi:hypothetical protein